jgi:N-methylhydantoinase B
MTPIASTRSGSDVVTTEIIRNLFQTCAEEMNAVLVRSAYSPVIYEARDCSVALLDPDGEVLGLSSGLPIFLGNLEICVKYTIETLGIEAFRPGDAFVLNDCYIAGAHLNDVTVFAPIFWNGQLSGFAATRAHWMDVGAKDPGVSMSSTDVFQEGLRMGPTKLFEDYEPRAEFLDLLKRNSRFPQQLVGDLNAQVAACRAGEQRFGAALARFGADTIWAARDRIFEETARLEREAIEAMPDGRYEAEGMLDSDGAGSGPVKVRVLVEISGDRISIDLDGTAPPVTGSINCGEPQTICAARVAYKCLVVPHRGVDGGSFSTLDVRVPEKTILSAEEPSACQYYYTPLGLLIDLVITALAEPLPALAAAAHYGDSMNVCFAGDDPRLGNSPYFSIEGTVGGWGAFDGGDGAEAVINNVNGGIKVQSIEVFEAKYPIRVSEYGLRPDSEGPGRWRGGFGVKRTYEFDADCSTYLWFERSVTPAWGLFGGESGSGPIVDISGSQDRHDLKVNRLPIAAGDTMTVYTGGGGGWGPPFERDPEAVLRDVMDGLVSVDRAEGSYGVVLTDSLQSVDESATKQLRGQITAR